MPDTISDLYDTDYAGWSERQAEALRRLAREHPELAYEIALDVGHLIEEVEDMGRSTTTSVETRLELLLMHLAKWRHQPERRGKSWRNTIREQRRRIPRILAKNPSLRPRLPAMLPEAWEEARHGAADETDLDLSAFPEACPFTIEQALDEGFWPD
ncbi:MAG: DUF29 domain-containing protein [Geminicoccaceae bacterium]|nr:DUF29 domain-containing protein [Geminicoccaceae bacterium]